MLTLFPQNDLLYFFSSVVFFAVAILAYGIRRYDQKTSIPWLWLIYFGILESLSLFMLTAKLSLPPTFLVNFISCFFVYSALFFLSLFCLSYLKKPIGRYEIASLFVLLGLLDLFFGGTYRDFMRYGLTNLLSLTAASIFFLEGRKHAFLEFQIAAPIIVYLALTSLIYQAGGSLPSWLAATVVLASITLVFLLKNCLPKIRPTSTYQIKTENWFAVAYVAVVGMAILLAFLVGNEIGQNLIDGGNGSLKEVVARLEQSFTYSKNSAITLARSQTLAGALNKPAASAIHAANQTLDEYKNNMDFSLCYLIDPKGIVIASSNRNDSDSLIGHDLSGQSYFSEALAGQTSNFAGIGINTNVLGFFSAAPVRGASQQILGVVALKQNLSDSIIGYLGKGFLINKNAEIILSSNPQFGLKNLFNQTEQGEPVLTKDSKSPFYNFLGHNYYLLRQSLDLGDLELLGLYSPNRYFQARLIIYLVFIFILAAILAFNNSWSSREMAVTQTFHEKERFEATLVSIGDGVILVDAQNRIQMINHAAEKLTGWLSQDILGRPSNEILNASWKNPEEKKVQITEEVLNTGKTVFLQGPITLTRKDGSQIMVAESAAPVHDQEGMIAGVVLVFRDITETTKINYELREKVQQLSKLQHELMVVNDNLNQDITERKSLEIKLHFQVSFLQNLIDAIPNPVFYKDIDGNYMGCNEAFENFFGQSRTEIMRKTDFDFFPKDIAAQTASRDAALFANPGVQVYEAEIKSADGVAHNVLFNRATFEDAIGKVGGLVSVLLDITQSKKTESELLRLNQIKDDFVSAVSHELRTPLSSIKEGISLVIEEIPGKINEKQKKVLEVSKRNVDRLHRLINDVLDFSKLQSGKIQLRPIAGDLVKTIRESAETFQEQANRKGIKLEVTATNNLPNILFDPDRVNQVMHNLISNALKYTDSGAIEVKILKDEVNRGIKVCVSDTGTGIASDDLPKLFQKFIQLGGFSNRKVGGTGLGLAISKEIIEQHGGSLWVESELGKGSKFWFTIPPSNQ
jgi:PAS domain S-box-containing protein